MIVWGPVLMDLKELCDFYERPETETRARLDQLWKEYPEAACKAEVRQPGSHLYLNGLPVSAKNPLPVLVEGAGVVLNGRVGKVCSCSHCGDRMIDYDTGGTGLPICQGCLDGARIRRIYGR